MYFSHLIVILSPLIYYIMYEKVMEEKEYLDNYEQRLTAELLKVCTQQGKLAGQLLPSPDLDDKWEEVAQPYMAMP